MTDQNDNAWRVANAAEAICAYAAATGQAYEYREDVLADFLEDLRHYCRYEQIGFDACDKRAAEQFDGETGQ